MNDDDDDGKKKRNETKLFSTKKTVIIGKWSYILYYIYDIIKRHKTKAVN